MQDHANKPKYFAKLECFSPISKNYPNFLNNINTGKH